APAGRRHKYLGRSPAECRQYRTDRRGTPGRYVRSRRLRALIQARDAAAAFGTDHLLRVVRGILGATQRRKLLAADELHDFVTVQDFALEQRLGDANHRFRMLVDDRGGSVVAALHELLHLLIDADGGLFGVVAVLRNLAA